MGSGIVAEGGITALAVGDDEALAPLFRDKAMRSASVATPMLLKTDRRFEEPIEEARTAVQGFEIPGEGVETFSLARPLRRSLHSTF